MAKEKGKSAEGRADRVSPDQVRVNGGDIASAARGFAGESYEKGYPETQELHNNQGRGGARVRGH